MKAAQIMAAEYSKARQRAEDAIHAITGDAKQRFSAV
jgi:hypothetical protein